MNILAIILHSQELLRRGKALRAAVALDFGLEPLLPLHKGMSVTWRRKGGLPMRATLVVVCGDNAVIEMATLRGRVRRVVDVATVTKWRE